MSKRRGDYSSLNFVPALKLKEGRGGGSCQYDTRQGNLGSGGGGCSPFGLTALEHVRYNIFDPYVTKIMLNCFLYMTNNLIFNNHIFNIQSARSKFIFLIPISICSNKYKETNRNYIRNGKCMKCFFNRFQTEQVH